MLRISWLLVPALLLWVASASTGATRKTTSTRSKTSSAKTKKSSSKTKASSTKSKSKTTAKSASKKSRTRTTSSRRRKPSFRSGQQKPTPERYTEIQSALARKGYLEAEPTGTWNDKSAEALKRFQQDQNLKPDGKITSHSLIALGLGPKRGAPPPAPPTPAPPQ
ncbi:MAG: peptidoglycan-binding protein [Acidobacteriia bacterium]|nr:peptidoglycan-binding protein [Terriglobia bacterium]